MSWWINQSPREVVQQLRLNGVRVYIDDEGVALFGGGTTPELFEWLNDNIDQLRNMGRPSNRELVDGWLTDWSRQTRLDFVQKNYLRDLALVDLEEAIQDDSITESDLRKAFDTATAAFKDNYKTLVDGRTGHVVVPQLRPTAEMKQRYERLFAAYSS